MQLNFKVTAKLMKWDRSFWHNLQILPYRRDEMYHSLALWTTWDNIGYVFGKVMLIKSI